ncbi:MAG TPA: O-antigen ligase domain-containing protein [Synechococcales cyanobacterium M55_K2018_004]|nr:O-antigen ligase domain-containing protein [Synechococcales cyanobacterium M55_K2018_004]
MSPLVYLALFGWIPVTFQLFQRFPATNAVALSVVFATLFLPQSGIALPVIPDYSKIAATSYAVLLVTCVRESARLSRFQPGWVDIPVAIWCLCPFVTSMVNGLGPYDGFTAMLEQMIAWGAPYFLGRLYLGSLNGLRQLAIAILYGGLVYVPLCLLETRISPQLHRMVYGFHAHSDFSQTMRAGGYRPMVFMSHGLALAGYMLAATLIAIWLWRSGSLKEIRKVKMHWIVVILVVTFILLKSSGALFLLIAGVAVMLTARWLRTGILLLVLVAAIIGYLQMGVAGTFTVENVDRVTEITTQIAGEERAASLRFRLDNEQILGERARERVVFGWGGWGRNRVFNDYGEDISVTDSLWILAFGINGAVGLVSLFSTLLLPPVTFLLLRYPARTWFKPQVAPAAALSVVLVLYSIDCVLNAMTNPVFTLAAGGLAGLVLNGDRTPLPKQALPNAKATVKQPLPASPRRRALAAAQRKATSVCND